MAFSRKTFITHSTGPHIQPAAGNSFAGYRQNLNCYSTTDTKAQVLGAGYFGADAAKLARVGDLITVTFDTDGTIGAINLIVTANDGAALTVAPFATS